MHRYKIVKIKFSNYKDSQAHLYKIIEVLNIKIINTDVGIYELICLVEDE